MERTKETLEARVRETPLADRLKECQKRIGNMCAELRGPKMSIPVEYYDDDFYICTTLADAQATVEALQRQVMHLDKTLADVYAQRDGLQRERDVLRRQVDTQRRTIQRYQASHDEHTQLQALVRALPVVGGDIELDIYGYVWAGRVEVCKFDNTGDAKSYADLLAYRATLDATTPDSNQLGAINDMVSKGGDGE